MDTIRQKLVDEVIARMQAISVANGYETNIGANVKDWPVRTQGTHERDELPELGVYDLNSKSTKEDLDGKTQERDLTIQLRCAFHKNTPAREARKMIGDMEKAIGVDLRWDKLATDTYPSREGCVIEAENSQTSAAVVEFTIHYQTCTFNPF